MGFKTRIQLIQRKASRQFYINFPSACAQMMNFRKGEEVEWEITQKGDLLLRRGTRKRK
mgnify:CR=1 FL=1|jgi:antitoxin component of MazEF toxin-antitoxin module